MVIDKFDVEYQWEHRHEMILVAGHYLEEEEVLYLIDVLEYLLRHDFYLHDQFITSSTIVRRCVEDFENMKQGREVCSVDTAEALLESNRVIGEYA